MLTVHQRPPIGGQWKRVTPAWRSFRPEPERAMTSVVITTWDGGSIAVRKGRRSRAVRRSPRPSHEDAERSARRAGRHCGEDSGVTGATLSMTS
jgi:hypothetical protein